VWATSALSNGEHRLTLGASQLAGPRRVLEGSQPGPFFFFDELVRGLSCEYFYEVEHRGIDRGCRLYWIASGIGVAHEHYTQWLMLTFPSRFHE
jgi:hypothetical protein